jgi:hypothetical protein
MVSGVTPAQNGMTPEFRVTQRGKTYRSNHSDKW